MEWQTWRTQNPLLERACGFKSHLGYHDRRPNGLPGSGPPPPPTALAGSPTSTYVIAGRNRLHRGGDTGGDCFGERRWKVIGIHDHIGRQLPTPSAVGQYAPQPTAVDLLLYHGDGVVDGDIYVRHAMLL